MKKILVVAAHPDDEILGCGGTVARLVDQGCEARTVILGEGVTARDERRDSGERRLEIGSLHQDMKEANAKIGVSEAVNCGLPDNRFDTVPLLDVIKIVEEIKSEYRPDTIFTHYENDLNVDHQVAYRAVVTATRPMAGESVRDLYAFEVQSSTEWRFPLSFSPDLFYDIDSGLERKIEAMSCYRSEVRDFPHPRSLESIRLNAKMWGIRCGLQHAEAFKTIRSIR